MREILFKAKCKKDGEWVEGYYGKLGIDEHVEHYIIQNMALLKLCDDWKKNMCFNDVEIIPETLCQYTGMKDIYGNKIWENDIARYKDDDIVTIEWDDDYRAFAVTDGTWTENLGEFEEYELEVYGNKFDNPELLEVEE